MEPLSLLKLISIILYMYRLFLIEGVPTVLVSCFTLWYIPVKPETAKFMTEEERIVEMERLAIGNSNNNHNLQHVKADHP